MSSITRPTLMGRKLSMVIDCRVTKPDQTLPLGRSGNPLHGSSYTLKTSHFALFCTSREYITPAKRMISRGFRIFVTIWLRSVDGLFTPKCSMQLNISILAGTFPLGDHNIQTEIGNTTMDGTFT